MPVSEKEFKAQFTALDPTSIYGNVDTNKKEAFSADLDQIHPKLNRGSSSLKLTGWDDPWSMRMQQFSHISTDDLKAVLKSKSDVVVVLNRVLMPNQSRILKYSRESYEQDLKQYIHRDDQEKILKSFRQNLSVFLVASPDGDGNPKLFLIGDFLPYGVA